MAYDKIIVIRSRLDRCLCYAQNEEKTDLTDALLYIENPAKARLQTAINCNLETAFQEMQATKRRWNKYGGILGYHIVHSYAPGEVLPEQAHAAGVEFAKRLLGSQYEAVICTHVDREHLHCHIVFNSVSFLNGKKYRSDFKSYFETLRGTSNAVSRDYGLSVIEPDGNGKPYAAWDAERSGKTTIRDLIRQDIDAALSGGFTLDSLLRALRNQGYTIKHGPNVKHTAIKPPGGQRFIQLDSLGEGYTETDILQRLRTQRSEAAALVPKEQISPKRYFVRKRPSRYPPVKRGSFRALYLYYFYLLSPRKKQRQKIPFQTRAEVRKLKQYTQQFRLLQKYRIDSQSELTMLEGALQAEIDALTDTRKQLYMQRRANPSEYPIAFIKYKTAIGISAAVCCFSPAGRKKIHDNLEIDTTLFAYLREHLPEGHSLEYADCSLSLLSAQKGKCAISGEWFLQPDSIVCHMKVPKEQGGQERYSNLVLLHRQYLPLLADQDTAALKSICKQLAVTRKQLTKINNLRIAAKLVAI